MLVKSVCLNFCIQISTKNKLDFFFFQDFTECLSVLKKYIHLKRMKLKQIELRNLYQDRNTSYVSTEASYPKISENVRCFDK